MIEKHGKIDPAVTPDVEDKLNQPPEKRAESVGNDQVVEELDDDMMKQAAEAAEDALD